MESANANWTERRSLLLELTDETGRTGQGEASPLPEFSQDSFDRVREELTSVDWASLPGPGVGPACDVVEGLLDRAGVRTPTGRFAAETALLDLAGQAAEVPMFELLACPARPRAARAAPPRVELAALLTGDVFAEARRRVDGGYRHLKLKVGRSPAEELAMLAELRSELGSGIRLRADANGSLPPDVAPAWLGSAGDLEFVEEPVPLRALQGREPSPVAIALDESLSPGDEGGLPAALEVGGYRYLVLKPSYHGGLIRCRRLARAARQRSVEPVVSHLFEGPVAFAAAAELALALAPCPAAGLAPHAGFGSWPPVDLPHLDGPRIVPHDAPGLGLPGLAELAEKGMWEGVRELT